MSLLGELTIDFWLETDSLEEEVLQVFERSFIFLNLFWPIKNLKIKK